MIEASVAPANPIVFILDPSGDAIVVPDYVSGEIIASTDTCVSVGIQADVDGETVVKLATEISDDDRARMHRVFVGTITTPSRKVAVVTAEFEGIVDRPVKAVDSNIEVWVDDTEYPAEVLVVTA